MLTLFAIAFALGLLFNAAPGAVFAETVRQGLRGGFRPAFAVQIGSLLGDAAWAVVGLAGAGLLTQLEALRWPLGLASAGYLAWLARDSWREARMAARIELDDASSGQGRALARGALLSLTNPQNIAYWAALGSALAGLGVADPSSADYAVFFADFMASSLLWCFFCAGLVGRMRALDARWARLSYRMCAAVLLALAVATLRDRLVERQGAQFHPPGIPWQR